MPPAAPVDTWLALPPSPTKSASGITPTRASRTKGITNDVAYSSFTRTPARGPAVTYELGDAVVVGPSFVPRQKWLGIPASFKRVPSKSKGKGKGKAKRATVEEVDDGWSHEDGLAAGEKVALIVGLYEDVVGRKMGKLRWLARPGAVWSADGPVEGEEVDPVGPSLSSEGVVLMRGGSMNCIIRPTRRSSMRRGRRGIGNQDRSRLAR
jgi:hypothetical protein